LSALENIRVVAFDCDGVMFDTLLANKAYYNSLLRNFGMPDMRAEQIDYIMMHAVNQSVSYLFEEKERLEAVHAYRKEMGYLPFIKLMEMEPGLKPLIKKLKPRFKTAVATNRSDTIGKVISEYGLDACFDVVVSSLDVKKPKPDPELLVKILEYFDIGPDQMIYIGDSPLDQMAATAAGVLFVAFNNGNLVADFHISKLRELETILGV
jgi:phosphoglycolate phosphatase